MNDAARRAGRYAWAWLAAEWAELRAAPPDRDRPRLGGDLRKRGGGTTHPFTDEQLAKWRRGPMLRKHLGYWLATLDDGEAAEIAAPRRRRGDPIISIKRERVPHPDRPGRHLVRIGLHLDLAGIVRRLRQAREWIADEWAFFQIDRWRARTREFYEQAGHPDPVKASIDEEFLRDYLESARDWVSVELLRTGRRPAELVAEWMDANATDFAEVHGYHLSRILVDVLTHMPKEELLHPTALAAERAREEAYLDELHQKHYGDGRIRPDPRTLYVLGIRKRPEPLPGDILYGQCPEVEEDLRRALAELQPAPRRKKGDPPKNRPPEATAPTAKRKSPAKRPKGDPPPEVTPPARNRKSPAKRRPATPRETPRGSSSKRTAPRE